MVDVNLFLSIEFFLRVFLIISNNKFIFTFRSHNRLKLFSKENVSHIYFEKNELVLALTFFYGNVVSSTLLYPTTILEST